MSTQPIKPEEKLPIFKQFDILKFVSEFFIKNKPREPHLKKMHLRADKISSLIKGYGGMSARDFARFCAIAGWKIIDQEGNTIIGNPENTEKEVSDNTPPKAGYDGNI